jgi:hypothetical protein
MAVVIIMNTIFAFVNCLFTGSPVMFKLSRNIWINSKNGLILPEDILQRSGLKMGIALGRFQTNSIWKEPHFVSSVLLLGENLVKCFSHSEHSK